MRLLSVIGHCQPALLPNKIEKKTNRNNNLWQIT